jgi:hypothetical protein
MSGRNSKMATLSEIIDQRARLMGYWEEALRVAHATGYWRDVEACGRIIEAFHYKVREVLISGAFSGDSAAALAAWDECGHPEREYRWAAETEARLQAPRRDSSVWCEVLGFAPNAPAEAIRAAYLDRLKRCHPDQFPGWRRNSFNWLRPWRSDSPKPLTKRIIVVKKI